MRRVHERVQEGNAAASLEENSVVKGTDAAAPACSTPCRRRMSPYKPKCVPLRLAMNGKFADARYDFGKVIQLAWIDRQNVRVDNTP